MIKDKNGKYDFNTIRTSWYIDYDKWLEVKKYCKKNGLKLNYFISQAVHEKMEKIKEQENCEEKWRDETGRVLTDE